MQMEVALERVRDDFYLRMCLRLPGDELALEQEVCECVCLLLLHIRLGVRPSESILPVPSDTEVLLKTKNEIKPKISY